MGTPKIVTAFDNMTATDASQLAQRLIAFRRVLLTGFEDLTQEEVISACNLAEAIGAAIDAGDSDLSRPAGPTIARAGGITADPREISERADLVIVWFCQADEESQQFLHTFVHPPLPSGLDRKIITFGPDSLSKKFMHIDCPHGKAVEAARLLQYLIHSEDHDVVNSAIKQQCTILAKAIEKADCLALISDHTSDHVGLGPWSITQLIREISHDKPAFEISLAHRALTDAASILTWRYGAAGAIEKANRSGGRFLPHEASAEQLIMRKEVDCVVTAGKLSNHIHDCLNENPDIEIIQLSSYSSETLVKLIASTIALLKTAAAGLRK